MDYNYLTCRSNIFGIGLEVHTFLQEVLWVEGGLRVVAE